VSLRAAGLSRLRSSGYVDAVKICPREAADQAAARAFLARHNSLRGPRFEELVHPWTIRLVAEAADGQLAGMLTYVPGAGTGGSARLSPARHPARR
jgi:hypothetical protein